MVDRWQVIEAQKSAEWKAHCDQREAARKIEADRVTALAHQYGLPVSMVAAVVRMVRGRFSGAPSIRDYWEGVACTWLKRFEGGHLIPGTLWQAITQDTYQRTGWPNRETYLQAVADRAGWTLDETITLADGLGQHQDFTKLARRVAEAERARLPLDLYHVGRQGASG